jgi:hypothetical protein
VAEYRPRCCSVCWLPPQRVDVDFTMLCGLGELIARGLDVLGVARRIRRVRIRREHLGSHALGIVAVRVELVFQAAADHLLSPGQVRPNQAAARISEACASVVRRQSRRGPGLGRANRRLSRRCCVVGRPTPAGGHHQGEQGNAPPHPPQSGRVRSHNHLRRASANLRFSTRRPIPDRVIRPHQASAPGAATSTTCSIAAPATTRPTAAGDSDQDSLTRINRRRTAVLRATICS